jgi:hypothetical protein
VAHAEQVLVMEQATTHFYPRLERQKRRNNLRDAQSAEVLR